jgi:glycosyl hydrolase family 25
MAWLRARDYSQYQGDVDFTQEPVDIALVKMSGGDNGLYLDPKASQNYGRAVKAGKGIMGWHFAGGTDPVNEANYAVRAMMPFAENDNYGLDWEVQHSDPVGWVLSYVTTFQAQTGAYPTVYMNGSTWNAYDWSPVTDLCGVWVAWWGISPDATVPIKYPYIIQQYDNSGTVVSNGARVDEDAVFITLDEWNARGYHVPNEPQPTQPQPAPTPAPAPEPSPVEPSSTPAPEPPAPTPTNPTPPATPPSNPAPTPEPTDSGTSKPRLPATLQPSVWRSIIKFIKDILGLRS